MPEDEKKGLERYMWGNSHLRKFGGVGVEAEEGAVMVKIDDLKAVFVEQKSRYEERIRDCHVQMAGVIFVQKLQELEDLYKLIFGEELKP